jgi:histidine triad (HIT) family protein
VETNVSYDTDNIFAKILRGEIPNKTVFEDEHVLAFHDVTPQRPVHILVIPKGAYINMDDFTAKASDAEVTALFRAVGKIAKDFGLDETGYRLLNNAGVDGHQEVMHLHLHIVGGAPAGPMLKRIEN